MGLGVTNIGRNTWLKSLAKQPLIRYCDSMVAPTAMRVPGALTPNRMRFVQEWLIDRNGTQAYIRAGFKVKNDRVARVESTRLLANPSVQAEIARRTAKTAAKLDVTQERIAAEYARIAFSDQRDFSTWDKNGVKLKDSSELTEDQSRAVAEVSEITTATGHNLRIKFHDKVKALDSLAARLWPTPKETTPINIDNRTQILMGYSEEQLRSLLAAMRKSDEKALVLSTDGKSNR